MSDIAHLSSPSLCGIVGTMSQLSDFRKSIHTLLNAENIEQELVDRGMAPAVAVRVARSRGVVAQASLPRRAPISENQPAVSERDITDKEQEHKD